MAERILIQGNEAIGRGAVAAGCLTFFGYPITPQNEVTEWFAKELPQREGVFIQPHSESGSINMLYGGAATGVRVMTSTSSPGWALMQETMSCMANAELPCVIVLVQRGGPGQGTTQHAQMDYLSATRGGGQGGYKAIVLAPASVAENCDLVQLGFHLSDKYRNPVVVLTDAIIGQMAEPVEIQAQDFGPLPPKDWAIGGKGYRPDHQRRFISCGQGQVSAEPYSNYLSLIRALDAKYRLMESEVRFDPYLLDDAQVVVVAYGYVARVAKEAVNMARREGLRVGLLRPITLWPFPYMALRSRAEAGASFLTVEDSLGQMIDDVRLGVEGRAPVHFLGMLDRHDSTGAGMLLPGRVLEEIKKVCSGVKV
ncbi:MAG: 3-methyl-2-oxobutanoate dehydrogenase subunit VorB [Dehalococcoidia bacterium]